MNKRLCHLAAVFTAGLVLIVGCGGEAGGGLGSESAAFAPADVAFFVAFDTDFDSSQWDATRALVDRFPDGDRLGDLLLEDLRDQGIEFDEDVRPALGPEVGLVALEFEDESPEVVGFTQSPDREKLEEVLEASGDPTVMREIEGWTVVAETEAAIDAFAAAREQGSLADSDLYTDAVEGVTREALVLGYLNGEKLPREAGAEAFLPEENPTFAFSLAAEEDGVRVEGAGRLAEGLLSSYSAELPSVVPGNALLYASFNDLETLFSRLRDTLAGTDPEFERDLGQLESMLGVSLEEDIAPLFAGEGALYVRGGGLIPEVTLLLEVEDEAQAVATVDELVEGLRELSPDLGSPRDTEIEGIEARELPVPPLALYYAAFDGRLVMTSSRAGVAELREEGDRLADDPDFRRALEDADVPDETAGFTYVDLEEIVRLVFSFAALGDESVPPELRENLEPLRNVVLYYTVDGERVTFSGFLSVE
jgi:hypothetical protein